jgi:hypothetical protein
MLMLLNTFAYLAAIEPKTGSKVALITGSNKGIGKEIARKLAATPDMTVILGCRNLELGAAAAKELAACAWPPPKQADVAVQRIDLADLATIYYKVTVTTMRDMPFPDWVTQTTRDRINLYYSVSQVLATGILLFTPSMERALFILFPIQIAAFLMTLVRKQIISPLSWHVLYAGSLGLNYLHSLLALDNLPVGFYLGCLLFCLMRFRYRWNKYFLWTLIGLVQVMVQNEFVQSMLKQGAGWTFTLSSYALGQTAPVCLTCS